MKSPERFSDSEHLCREVMRRYGRKVVLAFSNGKDSVAAWLQLHRMGFEVYPFYQYQVPGLAFIERSLRYYEGFFGRSIMRVPDPTFYHLVVQGSYMPLHLVKAVDDTVLELRNREWDEDDLERDVRARFGLERHTMRALGWREADSFRRRMAIRRAGAFRPHLRLFFPVYDWTQARMLEEIRAAGLKLPVDYRWFSRSFELKAEFVAGVEKHAPDDYARILAWFPLMGALLARRRFYEAEGLEAEAAEAEAAGQGPRLGRTR